MIQQDLVGENKTTEFQLGGQPLGLTDYDRLVNGKASLSVQISDALRARLAISVDMVTDAVIDNRAVYGVTTGFGGMSDERIYCNDVAALQSNLLTFLATGAGDVVDSRHTLGAMLLRASVLIQGKSGIRPELIERLVHFFRQRAVPVVRELGSIGASGDLVPLATIARAVTGQAGRCLLYTSPSPRDQRGSRMPSSD